MDHVLWEGLYADRVRTNWRFGTKDRARVTNMEELRSLTTTTMGARHFRPFLTLPFPKVNALRFTLVMKRKHER